MYWRDGDLTYQADDLNWASMRRMLSDAIPTVTDSAYIESDTKTTDSVTPSIVNPLIVNSLYGEDSANPVLTDIILSLDLYATDSASVTLLDDALSLAIQDTIIKYLSDTDWNTAVIKVKQSDGTWAEKPIYTRQKAHIWA